MLQCRQHFLNFLPLPHGQGSLRPAFGASRSNVSAKKCESVLAGDKGAAASFAYASEKQYHPDSSSMAFSISLVLRI